MIGMLHMIIAPWALSPPAVTFILDSSGPVVSWSPLSLTSVSLSLAQRLALDAMKEKKLQCVWWGPIRKQKAFYRQNRHLQK